MDELVPAWSGSLERARLAPGLSSYLGRSSLHHSASWEAAEGLERGECGCARPSDRPAYLPTVKAPKLTPERERAVAVLLRHGVSYRKLVRDFGVTMAQARRVARDLGITRVAAA